MPQGPSAVNIGSNGLASALHGNKFAQAGANNLFSGANAAGVQLSAALATSYVGLCLSNPAGSGKNLVLRRVTGTIIVAPAAFLALGLITGFAANGIAAHTTPITTLAPTLIGAAPPAPVGLLDSACTLVGTPRWAQWLAANVATGGNPIFTLDLEGAVVLAPGAYAAIGANAAGPAAGFLGSFEWEEVELPAA